MLHAAELITELQSLGLRLPKAGLRRAGGAGPAEGGTLVAHGRAFNVPTSSPFVADSPYTLAELQDELWVHKDGDPLLAVDLVPRPRFYQQTDGQGVSLDQVALLHGSDCLATTVLQTCAHWPKASRCRFCGIELSLAAGKTVARKTPAQLARAAKLAKELDHVTHVVLTTGAAGGADDELGLLGDCAAAITKASGLAVHAQFCPPEDLSRLAELKTRGVDTVGIHIESMDPDVLAEVAPVKAALGMERFKEAWQAAVEVFGTGQVETFLIAGLGESVESLVAGADLLADMGVYPFVVPLRPIPGSLLQDARPPAPEVMASIYGQVAERLAYRGLSSSECRAGCVRCGACGALWAYELDHAELTCHRTRTSTEVDQALAIRHQVFVDEQAIVANSDQDGHDQRSIHLVVESKGEMIGTVRVFEEQGQPGVWVGGRLAVTRGQRSSGAGQMLVREAMATVKREGCIRFLANVQQANVEFFEYIGWAKEGEAFDMHGWTHQLMVADLDRI